MKAAIMQPYFFPYLGYFQLIASVDVFVVYDHIEYTKRGWINRNRLLRDGQAVTFSLPLQKASDHAAVDERALAADFRPAKLLNQLRGAYARAPYFARTFPLIESVLGFGETNLFRYLHHSLIRLCEWLGIVTPLRVSSSIPVAAELRGQDKVLAICRAVGAGTYVNAIGGLELYSRADFAAQGLDLKFLRSTAFEYPQFGAGFVPQLSIIDVLMFNPVETVRARLAHGYELI